MIKKIISGAQTGADRAALDVAKRIDIPHGGWIPKGRLAEDGPVSKKYNLHEMPTASYSKRTEQNVIDSDGTLILSHGELTGGSLYTEKCADKHKRPLLHVDLNKLPAEEAVPIIVDWIFINKIEALNVAGSRSSKDPEIYEKTYQIINHVYWLCQVRSGATKITLDQPKTVDEVVEQIIAEMPLSDKVAVAKFTDEENTILKLTLGMYLRNQLRHKSVNKDLMEDCIAKSGITDLDEDEAATVILRELWNKLREIHRLKILK